MLNGTRVTELALGAAFIALLSACASEPAGKPEAATPAASTALPIAPPAQAGATRQQNVSGSSLGTGQTATIDKRSVYYDFDSSAREGEYKPVVEAHATYLKQHPGAFVRVEGNCDERGSREYNLALGQRRADSVVKMLELTGVPEARLEAVSYGKEKPRAAGHDEHAWSENRRSDFDYTRQ
jgi:peptidoglycan-associated lipoprotein